MHVFHSVSSRPAAAFSEVASDFLAVPFHVPKIWLGLVLDVPMVGSNLVFVCFGLVENKTNHNFIPVSTVPHINLYHGVFTTQRFLSFGGACQVHTANLPLLGPDSQETGITHALFRYRAHVRDVAFLGFRAADCACIARN